VAAEGSAEIPSIAIKRHFGPFHGAAASAPAGEAPSEWLTFGHDPQRSGWNSAETTLSPPMWDG